MLHGDQHQFTAPARRPHVPGHHRLRRSRLDVTDYHSIQAAVDRVLEDSGRIDVLVNNAGIVTYGPVECYRDDEVSEIFETNVTGVIRVIRAVLPTMRTQCSGRIINISSVSGVWTWPFLGIYAASKHALEAVSDALHFELIPYNIQVVLIESGDFQTEIENNMLFPESTKLRDDPLRVSTRDGIQPIGRPIGIA